MSAADREATFDGGVAADGILALTDCGDQGWDGGEASNGGRPVREVVANHGCSLLYAALA
jgi:hypothetical protein